jgi:hypothetical protein
MLLPLEEDSSQGAFPFMDEGAAQPRQYFDPTLGEIIEENQR